MAACSCRHAARDGVRSSPKVANANSHVNLADLLFTESPLFSYPARVGKLTLDRHAPRITPLLVAPSGTPRRTYWLKAR